MTETLQNVLEAMAPTFRACLEAQQASAHIYSLAEAQARIELEASPAVRESTHSACIQFARTLRWPNLSKDEAEFCFARVAEGIRFGHWLNTTIRNLPTRPAEGWLDFLLMNYWIEYGRQNWAFKLLENAKQ